MKISGYAQLQRVPVKADQPFNFHNNLISLAYQSELVGDVAVPVSVRQAVLF